MVDTRNVLKNLSPEFVRAELEYRRNKQSTIFSWCSTILVAITAGVIALETKQPPSELNLTQQVLLSWAIIVLAEHAVSWIGHNSHLEDTARGLFETQVATKIWGSKKPSVGYRSALIMLGVGALVATWLPPKPTPTITLIMVWSGALVATAFGGWGLYDYFARREDEKKSTSRESQGHRRANDDLGQDQ